MSLWIGTIPLSISSSSATISCPDPPLVTHTRNAQGVLWWSTCFEAAGERTSIQLVHIDSGKLPDDDPTHGFSHQHLRSVPRKKEELGNGIPEPIFSSPLDLLTLLRLRIFLHTMDFLRISARSFTLDIPLDLDFFTDYDRWTICRRALHSVPLPCFGLLERYRQHKNFKITKKGVKNSRDIATP